MDTFPSAPIFRVIAACVRADVPVLVTGSPGEAKSAKLAAWFAAWGYAVKTLVGSIREPADFLGYPMEDAGRLVYAPPSWASAANEAPDAVLIFDEFRTGAAATMKAMLRVIQEREVGDLKLQGHVRLIAISNTADDSVGGADLDAPIANRFVHLTWHFDAAEWLTHAATGFAHAPVPPLNDLTAPGGEAARLSVFAQISAFLNRRPDLLAPGTPADPDAASGPWPSPRSWTNLADVLTFIHPGDDAAVLTACLGTVGEGAATEFVAWRAGNALYDLDAVLDGAVVVDWAGDRPDRLYALCQALVSRALGQPVDVWNAVMTVFEQAAVAGRVDVVVPAVRTMAARPPRGAVFPAGLRTAMAAVAVHGTFDAGTSTSTY